MQFLAQLDEDEMINISGNTDLMGELSETELGDKRKSFFSVVEEEDDYDMPMTTPFTVHIELATASVP